MSDPKLDALLSRARDYTTHSHAAQTFKNYAADWKYFTAWCAEHGRRPLPASPETILCFIASPPRYHTVCHRKRSRTGGCLPPKIVVRSHPYP